MTSSRRPRIALPTTSSETPKPYTGAVSMKLMPWSNAAWIARIESASSCPPHFQPPIAHAPRPTTEALKPDLPSGRLRMEVPRVSLVGVMRSGGIEIDVAVERVAELLEVRAERL